MEAGLHCAGRSVAAQGLCRLQGMPCLAGTRPWQFSVYSHRDRHFPFLVRETAETTGPARDAARGRARLGRSRELQSRDTFVVEGQGGEGRFRAVFARAYTLPCLVLMGHANSAPRGLLSSRSAGQQSQQEVNKKMGETSEGRREQDHPEVRRPSRRRCICIGRCREERHPQHT